MNEIWKMCAWSFHPRSFFLHQMLNILYVLCSLGFYKSCPWKNLKNVHCTHVNNMCTHCSLQALFIQTGKGWPHSAVPLFSSPTLQLTRRYPAGECTCSWWFGFLCSFRYRCHRSRPGFGLEVLQGLYELCGLVRWWKLMEYRKELIGLCVSLWLV